MAAKDTVMSKDKLQMVAGEASMRRRIPTMTSGETYVYYIAKAQAEISFKAGIKEVVEWIADRLTESNSEGYALFNCDKTEWQAQLKEWGLGKDIERGL